MKYHIYSGLALSFFLTLPTSALSLSEKKEIIQKTSDNLLSLVYQLEPAQEASPPQLVDFSDVREGSWYEESAQYVVAKKIMSGSSDSTFSPDGLLTRGLLATVLSNMAQANLGTSPEIFLDASYSWYGDSAHWVADKGIMVGITENTFGGEQQVSRQDLAVVLLKYAQYADLRFPSYSAATLAEYQDGNDTHSYASEAMAWAVGNGFLLVRENHIRPLDYTTRAEIAYAVKHFLEFH